MKELLRIVGSPSVCGYLPWETASLELRIIDEMRPLEYADLLARGYRRFGWQLFRPACARCVACRSLRVVVPQFALSPSERRVLRVNQHIRAERYPLFGSAEHVDLFNRYQQFMHQHRGWKLQCCTRDSYEEMFLSGSAALGTQWMYFEESRLVGVAIMDEVPDAVSLVYFFHDPAWRAKSPGTYSVLKQLLYAKANGLRYAYLGYWVSQCASLSYKSRFRPHEILTEYVGDGISPEWK